MSEVKSVSLPNLGLTVKLGMVHPKAPPKVLRLKNFLLAPVGAPLPEKVDYYSSARTSLSRMYRNDVQGCCVIAGKAHNLGVWSANDGSPTVTLTDGQIDQLYAKLKAGPGDSGCIITDVLDYLSAYGFPDDKGQTHKIDGYVAADVTNAAEVKTALYLFGALTIGFMVTDAMVRKCREGVVWTRADFYNSQLVGGHDVSVVGYDATGVQVSTWGVVCTFAWDLFTDTRCVTECYPQLAPLWYGDDKISKATSLDVTALKTALDQLKSGVVPPIPEPTPPAPGPVDPPAPVPPVPPSPPAPVPPAPVVSDVVLTGLIPGAFGTWNQVTLKGTMTPRKSAETFAFHLPTVAEIEALAESVFALLKSDPTKDATDAVMEVITAAKAGRYGDSLMAVLRVWPAVFVLAEQLTALVQQFRGVFGRKGVAGFGPADVLAWADAVAAVLAALNALRRRRLDAAA